MLDVALMLLRAIECGWLKQEIQERVSLASRAVSRRVPGAGVRPATAMIPVATAFYLGASAG